ncbi:hypothetical protein HPP92_006233 [Vanilla planifolia]|uniref:Uncharacterized protein n=1 Tax=Vanilla planifolia TaxID=51239 RepID=A0A835RTJ2_VANPL|nr:hypothetical protein HPP92_006233 [Vanilla planifolia]
MSLSFIVHALCYHVELDIMKDKEKLMGMVKCRGRANVELTNEEIDKGRLCVSAGCRTSNDGLLHRRGVDLPRAIAVTETVHTPPWRNSHRGSITMLAIEACHGNVVCFGDGQWAPSDPSQTWTKESDMLAKSMVSVPLKVQEVDWWDPHLSGAKE